MKKLLDKKIDTGITLIALVITIVVLIILAAVAINLTFGDNGIFRKAKTAKEMYQNAEEQEKIDMQKSVNFIDGGTITNDREQIQTVFNKIQETTQIQEFDFVANKTNGQVFTVPEDGYYKIECWGAQGGDYGSVKKGGKGAYTKGIIKLQKDEVLYVYVGENYNGYKENYSFNGGGPGSYYTNRPQTNGGGATDIRIQEQNANWDDFNSLKSRIMVAAGGGRWMVFY